MAFAAAAGIVAAGCNDPDPGRRDAYDNPDALDRKVLDADREADRAAQDAANLHRERERLPPRRHDF